MPKRIQLSRRKGWKMPPNCVKVDRSTRYGNPFTVADCRAAGYTGTDDEIAKRCVEAFRVWLGKDWRENWDGEEPERRRAKLLGGLAAIRGKDLACWCRSGAACHADVLLEIANA